jgi:hypothetical protein
MISSKNHSLQDQYPSLTFNYTTIYCSTWSRVLSRVPLQLVIIAPTLHPSVSSEYSQIFISCLLTCGCPQISNNGFCALSIFWTKLFKFNSFDSKSGNATVTQILRQSFWEEGNRFLFKGWTPAFIRMGPNTVLLFVFYEVS